LFSARIAKESFGGFVGFQRLQASKFTNDVSKFFAAPPSRRPYSSHSCAAFSRRRALGRSSAVASRQAFMASWSEVREF
jgi:hypothetical protein